VKVFLDTNVLVAALATRGLCADVVRLVISRHDLLLVPVVVRELEGTLRGKLGIPADRVDTMLAFLRDFVIVDVNLGNAPALLLRDPDDVEVARSAIAVGAEVLVTGDRDLLEAELPIRVLSPRGFWEMLRERSAESDEVHER
jgi:putative PIN family toxin of toxin-antitoxin system